MVVNAPTTITSEARESRRAEIRARFVEAARELFFAHGYGATAMSAVAAKVGGSKTTLWAYFPSKEALFAAVVDDLIETYGTALAEPLDPTLPVGEALTRFGRSMLGIVLAPPMLELQRLVIGEAGRFPELGAMMFERGPKRGKNKLAAYLSAAMADGRVQQGDPEIMARQFAFMCQSRTHQGRMFGQLDRVDDAMIDDDVDAAVATAMAAWKEN
jgi:TetR/AcrR family transcriptional regulator, mexJK operon transcriptional repressor